MGLPHALLVELVTFNLKMELRRVSAVGVAIILSRAARFVILVVPDDSLP